MKKTYPNKKKTTQITTMVNKSNIRDHTIIADRFLTKLSSSYTAEIVATTGNAQAQFEVYGNSVFEPFNVPGILISTALQSTLGSVATQPPIGYTALATLYNQYIVRGSRIKITVQPSSLIDNFHVIVFPVLTQFSSGTANPHETQNQRYSRFKLCTASNNVKENTIIHYMNSSEVLGYTKQQYEDQPPTLISNAPNSNLDWFWQIAINQAQGATNPNSGVYVNVEIDMYCEFKDPVQQAM
jgi:hypothetical protein